MTISLDADLQQAIARFETLVRSDPGNRGFAALVPNSELLEAARELLAGERVILVTGFCIRDARIGETDGPPGTLALADALRALGKKVLIVTDAYSETLLSAGAAVYGAPFRTLCLELPQENADRQIDALLQGFAPTQIVAIERPGSAFDGHLYSMRGERLDDLVAKADRLFVPGFPFAAKAMGAPARNYRTIAIGDGGNELGFGAARDAMKDEIAHGELIFCATPADHLIPAGISNWGAYALVAALSVVARKLLIAPPERERQVLAALVGAGAVDGVSKANTMSVDGLACDDYLDVIARLYDETRAQLASGQQERTRP